jgi:drug/metabolite transporter (DMT)-like permease
MKRSLFQNKRNVVFLAIFYTFLWGTAFPLVKICMDSFGVIDNISKCLVAGIRFFISGAALLVFCAAKEPDGIKLNKNQIKYAVLYGITGTAIQYSVTYIGLSYIDGSKGAIFDQLCVFIIILTSASVFKDEKLNINKVAGCVVGFIGVLAINTDAIGFSFSVKGEGMMVIAAFCQVVAYFIAKDSADKVSAAKLVGYGQFIGGVVLVIFSVIAGGKTGDFSIVGVITLLMLSAISAVAYVLSLIPLKYFPASEISVFNLLITVFGVVMSGIVLGENIFKINYLVSILLISIGIIAVNYKMRR